MYTCIALQCYCTSKQVESEEDKKKKVELEEEKQKARVVRFTVNIKEISSNESLVFHGIGSSAKEAQSVAAKNALCFFENKKLL
jgi:dsRNA-specific ribonuclease